MSFGLVIPCYNEALRLKIDAYLDFLDAEQNRDHLICFVNDGSTDNTREILRLIKRQYPGRVEVLDMPTNKGKAEAVRTGFIYFLQDDNVDSVGFIDADLSTNFKEYIDIVSTYRKLEGNDNMIFGSRPLGRGYEYQRKWSRTVISVIARSVIRRVIGLPVMDTQCGAKVMSTELAEYFIAQPFQTRWLFDVELFMRLKKLKGNPTVLKSLHEVHLKEWVDVRGSKITIMDAIEMPAQIIWIWCYYRLFPRIRSFWTSIQTYFASATVNN